MAKCAFVSVLLWITALHRVPAQEMPEVRVELQGKVVALSEARTWGTAELIPLTNALYGGRYEEAFVELRKGGLSIRFIESPREASLLLDRLTRAVMEARCGLRETRRPLQGELDPKRIRRVSILMVPRSDIWGQNPLLVGDYEESLRELNLHRKRLEFVEDPKLASLLLDEMSRAIIEARRALWESERLRKKEL